MDVDAYCKAYEELSNAAPKRPLERPYFVGHTGFPSTVGKTTRREEHFAIAMVNAGQSWLLPDGTRFDLIDYQMPLKAVRGDREIGKIDLFGLTETGRPVIVELKVVGHSGGPSDPPPVALLEGLRYASIVEANLKRIASEVRTKFGRSMVLEKPIVLVLGEADWWSRWLGDDGQIKEALGQKATQIGERLGLQIVFGALTNSEVQYGHCSLAPRLQDFPRIEYPDALPNGRLSLPPVQRQTSADHEAALQSSWWQYAETLPDGSLDGIQRRGRPPVASEAAPSANLVLPDDETVASGIENEITIGARHRHFGSFRSSQAIAQSVFGAFKASGRLELMSAVPAECGRPAFGAVTSDTSLCMEMDVRTLQEPRPTQLDVCLETEHYRVAVECKFCETEFGCCSRIQKQRTGVQVCDGTYTQQQGRTSRCALSEIGVRYWELIPHLFDWDATDDHSPCPLLPTYQIVRNALAAVVSNNGKVDPTSGHAVFVYDARNPAYKPSGVADVQLRQATRACIIPGLIRRVTWQEIVRVGEASEDMLWLVSALRQKHGIAPE